MNKHPIPEAVLKKAKDILSLKGGFVKYLGNNGKYDVYYSAVKGSDTGFPFVYLVNGNEVQEITGFDALHVSSPFFKD